MKHSSMIAGGVGIALGFGATVLAVSRASKALAADPVTPLPGGDDTLENDLWTDVLPLPTEKDVKGDLERNWGSTPTDLRPLFLLMEEASGIKGAGRIFAVIAKRESVGFQINAHNADSRETLASCRAYANRRDKNPPLTYGVDAALFGSGGLFGALAPYFLWTAVMSKKNNAPLLSYPPEAMFLPRVAGFAAAVYMFRLLRYYQITDHGDIKAGWANPSFLVGNGRGSNGYIKSRTNFFGDADALDVDLDDTDTIPGPVLDWRGWTNVDQVRTRIIGPKMPRQKDPRAPLGEDALTPCLERLK